jgi:hypothetical protein
LPIAVDGTVASVGRHYFKFKAAAGQSLSFEVLARRLGSPLDPVIYILDINKRVLAYSDDVPGLRADCQLCYTFKKQGDYLIRLGDSAYKGGAGHFFRLRIGDFPCVSVPYPMGIKRGVETAIVFAGQHVDGIEPVTLMIPADSPLDWVNVGAKRTGGKSSGFVTLAVGSTDEHLEKEPNNKREEANRVTLGSSINGQFHEAGDTDYFTFAAKKGQKFTRRQGAPTALYMRLFNSAGSQVAEKEDFGVGDSVIDYTFPADGDFTLAVRDMHRNSGTAFAYRVTVKPTQTGFTLAASADHINIAAGGTAMITVTSVRKGYNGPITVEAVGLPKGITSIPTVIGPGTNSVGLTLQGAATSPAARVFPIRIIGRAKIGNQDFESVASISGMLKAALSGLPWSPETLSNALAVGISPKPSIRLRTETASAIFGRDLKTTVKVIVERDAGFDEQITLALTPAKGALPAGIAVAVKPIPKGKNEISIVISGNNKAPLGEFTAVLTATHKKGKKTITQVVPGLKLTLKAPFVLTGPAQAVKMAQGAELKVMVKLERNPSLKAPVELTLQNLPKGVTAAKVTIAPGQDTAEFLLKAAKDAAVTSATVLTIDGNATVGKVKYNGKTQFPLTLEKAG